MQVNQESTSFSNTLNQEYAKAVQNGFKGTFEEYYSYRDYVRE